MEFKRKNIRKTFRLESTVAFVRLVKVSEVFGFSFCLFVCLFFFLDVVGRKGSRRRTRATTWAVRCSSRACKSRTAAPTPARPSTPAASGSRPKSTSPPSVPLPSLLFFLFSYFSNFQSFSFSLSSPLCFSCEFCSSVSVAVWCRNGRCTQFYWVFHPLS